MRSLLSGTRYPMTLLSSVLMRIRADRDVNALRAGLLNDKMTLEAHAVDLVSVLLDKLDNLHGASRLRSVVFQVVITSGCGD